MTNIEINKLIAEKVMGWQVVEYENIGLVEVETEDEMFYLHEFQPSTNIKDAWEVIEKLQVDWVWEMKMHNSANEVDVQIGRWYATNKSVPLAICLAALKLVGEDIE